MSDVLRKNEKIKHIHVTPLYTYSQFITTIFTTEGRILQKRDGREDRTNWVDITPFRAE